MIKRRIFGECADGTVVEAIEIGAFDNMRARILTYGANLAGLWVSHDLGGRNVVLGHDRLEPYLRAGPVNGAIVGRFANRIANGRFPLDGRTVRLDVNLPPHTIHGGPVGFANRLWQAEADGDAVVLRLHSADGDQGFPGAVDVEVRYQVSGESLHIDYGAVTDAPTIINLTNHAYFNLSGANTIRDHQVFIAAEHFLGAGPDGIPTGTLEAVAGTPLDLRKPTLLGNALDVPYPVLSRVGGFDHHYVFSRDPADSQAVVAGARADGLRLDVRTSEPGLQFYTGNFLKAPNRPGAGLCFETQHAPNSPNHPAFPSTVLRPGQPFKSHTEFRFSADRSDDLP